MNIKRLNTATFFQGVLASLINTYVIFELNKNSLFQATLWSAVYVLGTISSGLIKSISLKHLKLYSHLIRILLILTAMLNLSPQLRVIVLTFLGFLVAMFSRKQFIDLKIMLALKIKNFSPLMVLQTL